MKTKQLSRGWKEVELKDLGELIMGQSPKGESYNNERIGVPLLNGAADFKGKKIMPKQFTTKPTRLSKRGDLIFCIRATIGKTTLSDGEYCLGRGVAGFRVNNKLIERDFLLKILDNKLNKLVLQGSTILGVKAKDIDSIKIPLPFTSEGNPDLETQKKIVSILEKAEQLKEKRKKSIEVLDEYLKSVFSEMFLKKKFEKVELGDKKLFDTQSGGTPSRDKKEYWENGTIPWIGSTACKDSIINEAEQFITEEGLKNSSARLFPKNTVLVALVGATIGKTGILNFECATNQNIAGIIIKDKKKVDEIYLFFMLKNLYNKFISLSSASFKMANLSFVRSLKIPLPPIELQEQFSSIVKHVEKLKEKQKKSQEEIGELFNALMQKAFKGELV